MTNKISNNEMALLIISIFMLIGFFVYMQKSSSMDTLTVKSINDGMRVRDSIYMKRDSVIGAKIISLTKRVSYLEWKYNSK